MPKNKVNNPITEQEIAFARLVLSGTMTDRQAAEAVGLNLDTAAYTKAKPRVRDYMLEHRAAVEKELVQQEAESRQRLNQDREKVLDRLWEIANLSPEMTRGSITGQVKAISMVVAIQGLIPDRRTLSSGKKPAGAPQISTAARPDNQQGKKSTRSQALLLPSRKKGLVSPGLPTARQKKDLQTLTAPIPPSQTSFADRNYCRRLTTPS